MQKKIGTRLAILMMGVALALTVSCQKKTVAVDDGTKSTARAGAYGSSTTGQSSTGEEAHFTSTAGNVDDDADFVLKENVFFEYDKATLTPEARETLAVNGKWLRMNADIMITIEGHCDERGTNAYNLALGDRRAETVKIFLVDLGIDKSRLSTVSYGEERPLDHGQGEAAWSRNRRAHFLIR